ncbi:exonuclease domain-containing protein [Candidatus Poriferisodalis sp.]|uniref:exonuclease domain-containing protein n=1 Tax=Candidatus Poriferisodalis sp. TaxID=3101277 RepID=UPI003B01AA47
MACVVVDVEATCWDDLRHPHSEREIIEIGAVRLDDYYVEQSWFSQTVRPVRHRELSEFCTQLTGITQAEVDAARGFAEVLADFVAWAGAGEHWLCSWGVYDRRQLAYDAEFHGVALPEWFVTRHVDIRRGFIRWRGIDRCSLLHACKLIGQPFAGAHHRGLDDARNAAIVLGAWQRAHAQLRARAAVLDVS